MESIKSAVFEQHGLARRRNPRHQQQHQHRTPTQKARDSDVNSNNTYLAWLPLAACVNRRKSLPSLFCPVFCLASWKKKVEAIARGGKHQHLIIESTGISDPTPVAEALVASGISSDNYFFAGSNDEEDAESVTGGNVNHRALCVKPRASPFSGTFVLGNNLYRCAFR